MFRAVVRTGAPPTRLGPRLTAWQQRDFAALDEAWMQLAARNCRSFAPRQEPPQGHAASTAAAAVHSRSTTVIRRAYLERPRGHSKTTDMAIQVAWILQFARRAVRGLAAAADQDQARLIHAAVADLVQHNPTLCPNLDVLQNRIVQRRTGSQLEVIASDVGSSWGQLPDFVICDELCHWPRPELWYSLCSAAAKQSHCVLAVLTNAGHGTGWPWQVRETARTSPAWYFSSLAGSQAPWIAPAALEEQRRLLPPSVFARLWENVWQHSDGEFVTLAEAEACRDPHWTIQTKGVAGRLYFAGVDYAEKHDRTVGVIVHREGNSIVVDRMDVVAPRPGRPVLVDWVEVWMIDMARRFGNVRFVLDEYQLLSIIQRLSRHYAIERFDFASGRGHHALAMTLRNLIVHRRLKWYPGCGEVCVGEAFQTPATPEVTVASASRTLGQVRDDLETELASLVLRNVADLRMRIDHRREPGCHDDRAFALGAACLAALRDPDDGAWYAITPPDAAGGFNIDACG